MRRVVLADDHIGIHALIRQVLEPEFVIVDSVYDGQALVDAALIHAPEVLVVDIAMPGMSGIEALRRLDGFRPRAVVMLTTHADPGLLEQALGAGALGYVLKAKAATDLAPAIRAALEGRRFVSAGINGGSS